MEGVLIYYLQLVVLAHTLTSITPRVSFLYYQVRILSFVLFTLFCS